MKKGRVMKKLKVAQMIGSVFEGGVEACVMNYYNAIDTSKVEFDFFVDRASKIIDQERIEALGGKVIVTPHYTHIFKYLKFVRRQFKENNYDIVHAEMTTLNFIPLLIAKSVGIKVRISHGHSTSNEKEKAKNIIKKLLRPISKCGANHYFACSEKAGRWLYGDKFFDSGNVTIINNAIDLQKFKFSANKRREMREKLEIDSNAFVVGHIGRFCAQKNHEFLLSVFSSLLKIEPNSFLVLVGEGEDFERIKELASSMGISERILFMGSRKNPQDFYNVMDVFVLPSLYEGLPIVAIEAQTNGLPCFFSTEVTKEAGILDSTVFLPLEESPGEWADKIVRVKYSEDSRNKGFDALINTKYSIKKEAEKLLKLYDAFSNS